MGGHRDRCAGTAGQNGAPLGRCVVIAGVVVALGAGCAVPQAVVPMGASDRLSEERTGHDGKAAGPRADSDGRSNAGVADAGSREVLPEDSLDVEAGSAGGGERADGGRVGAACEGRARTKGVRAVDGGLGRGLDRVLTRYLADRPGRAEVAVYDRTTAVRYAYRERAPFLLASVAKVDILLALMLKAQREDRRLSRRERYLASRMIRFSDNESAHQLYTAVGGKYGLTRALRRVGVDDTWPGSGLYWGATRSTPADQVRVLDRLTDADGPVSAVNRRYALHLMSSVTRDQAWGVSAAASGGRVALKNGWIPARVHGGLWTVNSVGQLTVDGHELLIAVLSERSPAMGAGIATVERVARLTVRAFTRDRA